MATVPLSGTDIRFLASVPFTRDYKHTRWFENETHQRNYFNGRPTVHVMTQANFQRIDGKTLVRVNRSIDDLFGTCYLMFRNSQYSNKWFYAFVTKIEYINSNMTHVHFEIDVLQTWRFQFNMKDSFVVREHCPLWNGDGTPVINTVEEGLDYGTDYDIMHIESVKPKFGIYWLVIVTKSLIHKEGDKLPNTILSSYIGAPQPLSYYVHPFKDDGSSPTVNINGVKSISSIKEVLSNIYSQQDAVNNIVSLYVTDSIGVDPSGSASSINLNSDRFGIARIADDETLNINTVYVKDLKSFSGYDSEELSKYYGFSEVRESKLLMHPYAFAELTDFKGNSFPVKLEYSGSGTGFKIHLKGSLGVSNKVAYQVKDYNMAVNSTVNLGDRNRVELQNGIINNQPQDVPIITDMLSAYLQGNRNSLQNQENSILFNGAMSVASSAISGVASGGTAGMVGGALSVVGGLGNTTLALQGLEAKRQDISNLPPTLSKMGSNTAFDFGYYYTGAFIVKKQIKREYRKKLADFFKAFGYKVNELKRPNFHTRENWNYIQTLDCNMTGNFNGEDLEEIKTIFNNGITLWHTDDVGNYNLTNGVI